jgi:hypothetical protein
VKLQNGTKESPSFTDDLLLWTSILMQAIIDAKVFAGF